MLRLNTTLISRLITTKLAAKSFNCSIKKQQTDLVLQGINRNFGFRSAELRLNFSEGFKATVKDVAAEEAQ